MQCSSCGKDVPFTGKVCPYCHRDKSRDQNYTVWAMVLGIGLAWLGATIWGFWGAVGGFLAGCTVAAIISGVGKTQAPKVQVVGPDEGKPSDRERLRKLKTLFDDGLIEAEEYEEKKREILSGL